MAISLMSGPLGQDAVNRHPRWKDEDLLLIYFSHSHEIVVKHTETRSFVAVPKWLLLERMGIGKQGFTTSTALDHLADLVAMKLTQTKHERELAADSQPKALLPGGSVASNG